MIQKQLINAILDHYNNNVKTSPTIGAFARFLGDQLEEVSKIDQGIRVALAAIKDIENECLRKKETQREKISSLQKECQHWLKTYYSDPAGGNDSYYECNICGKNI